MTPQQVDCIVESFALVLKRRDEAGLLFYKRLFAIAPELKPLFKNDLTAQSRKLIDTLGRAIESLRDTPALSMTLRSLGARHRDYGARPEHYALVGESLIATLASVLGPAFDAEARAAWITLYREVSAAMIAASSSAAAA